MGEKNDLYAHAIFGDTNRADGVPDCSDVWPDDRPGECSSEFFDPEEGPVYLEGRLVLSLSFRGEPAAMRLAAGDDDPVESYVLWDDLTDTQYDNGLVVLRYEMADVVALSRPYPTVLWEGAVDTRARVILQPDLDEAGMIANQGCDLRWKRV